MTETTPAVTRIVTVGGVVWRITDDDNDAHLCWS